MSMISPLRLIVANPISCAVGATAVAAFCSAPTFRRENAARETERSIRLSQAFGFTIGALSLVSLAQQLSRLRTAWETVDAMEALKTLRKGGFGVAGAALSGSCLKLADGLREREGWALRQQCLLGHRQLKRMEVKDVLRLWKSQGESAYPTFAVLSDNQLQKVFGKGKMTREQLEAMFTSIGRQDILVACNAEVSDEEAETTAIEACFPYVKSESMTDWLRVFDLAQFDQDAMQNAFVEMGIVSGADFKREILDKVSSELKGKEFDEAVRLEIARRRGVVAPGTPWRSHLGCLSLWALVTVAMAQRSPRYFALGVAAGLGERLVRGRETSLYEWGEGGLLTLPLRGELIVSDLMGGRGLGVRCREWGPIPFACQFLYPEACEAALGLLTVPIALLTSGDGFRRAALLSSLLAGRGFLHTLAETAEELTTPPSQE
jgi:hypothetical protein